MDFKRVIKWLNWNEIPPEFISSLLVFLIIIILILFIHFNIKKYDPLKKPSTFINIIESLTSFTDKQVSQIMGPAFNGYGGFILYTGLYIFLGFLVGMIGLPNIIQPTSSWALEALPNPFTNLAMPLALALVTFGLTHFTAMKYKHWSYFKRYTEPFAIFLPINLVTMWSNVLSLTLRLFGNALAGYCVITLIYVGIGTIIPPLGNYSGLALTPLLAPIAHLYFDIFDGLIQLAVFCILTMINVSTEYISPSDYKLALENKKLFKEQKHLKKIKKKELKANA